ncbi:MAG: exosome complex protein Rrp42 [Candidatus Nanoarchaeia archaeon]
MDIPNINKRQIANLLKENKRLDSRGLLEYRNLLIEGNISINAEGSARVKLGNTDVIVGIKMDTQEPYTDHEDEGTLVTGMEFSPMAGARYEAGPPKMDSIEIARIVDRGIRESGFIDWKKLCIKEGETVWSIAIDIYCINDDGNVLDASAIGALAALKSARFPKYDEKTDKVEYGEFTDTPLPLTEKVPFQMTFHKIGNKIFIDPTREEEDTSEARITLAVSCPKKDKMINAMQKGNEDVFTIDELNQVVEAAEKIYDEMFPKIEKKIKDLSSK